MLYTTGLIMKSAKFIRMYECKKDKSKGHLCTLHVQHVPPPPPLPPTSECFHWACGRSADASTCPPRPGLVDKHACIHPSLQLSPISNYTQPEILKRSITIIMLIYHITGLAINRHTNTGSIPYIHVHTVHHTYMYIQYTIHTCTYSTPYIHVHTVHHTYMYIQYKWAHTRGSMPHMYSTCTDTQAGQ